MVIICYFNSPYTIQYSIFTHQMHQESVIGRHRELKPSHIIATCMHDTYVTEQVHTYIFAGYFVKVLNCHKSKIR